MLTEDLHDDCESVSDDSWVEYFKQKDENAFEVNLTPIDADLEH